MRYQDQKDLVMRLKEGLMIGTYVLSAGYYDAYYLKGIKSKKINI